MKHKIFVFFFLFSFSNLGGEEHAHSDKLSIRSRVERILSEFQNELKKDELSKMEILPENASPREAISFFEIFLEQMEIPYTLLSRVREEPATNVHYEVPAWVNLGFLARKFTRKPLSRIHTDYQVLKDEAGESMTIHGEFGSGSLLIGLHKKHPKGKVCIVVDDMGHFGKGLPIYLSMNQPVVFSILPFYNTSPLQAKTSYKEGFEIMLHVPMQPGHDNYFQYENIITKDLEEEDLISRITTVFSQVPFISGWNNHQGSKATSDKRTMEIIMKELSKTRQNLYFIDSMTSPKTFGYSMARTYGIPSAKRNFDFLDNRKTKQAIQLKLRQLLQRAKRAHNPVIAILHETQVSAISLKEMLPQFQLEEIEFVNPTDFL